jgi:preprotein translocase subunit YajC
MLEAISKGDVLLPLSGMMRAVLKVAASQTAVRMSMHGVRKIRRRHLTLVAS